MQFLFINYIAGDRLKCMRMRINVHGYQRFFFINVIPNPAANEYIDIRENVIL